MPRPVSGKNEEGMAVTRQFTGTDHADTNYKLKIDVGTASEYSESLQMTVIQGMYDKGDITKYQFIKYAPKNLVTTEMREDFEREEKKMMEQQEQQAMMAQNADSVVGKLNPEEQDMLQQDPSILDEVMREAQGAM